MRTKTTSGQLRLFDPPTVIVGEREHKPRPKVEVLECCPSCGKMRVLTRGFYALLCSECHESITGMARRPL